MVTDFWKSHPPAAGGNITEGFVSNLKELKRLSKIWAHSKRDQEVQTLSEIESEIAALEDKQGGVFISRDQKDKITELISKRGKILKDREETWRLRSRAIWLMEGDENTKFFHKFANGRKAINTIWQLTNEPGDEVHTFQQLASLATS